MHVDVFSMLLKMLVLVTEFHLFNYLVYVMPW